MKIKKVLIIRFSSFGDIVQCSTVVDLIHRKYPDAQIDWVTREDFGSLVKLNQKVHLVWSFNKKNGLKGLFKLGLELRHSHYDFVYDAHNNLRSKLLSFLLRTQIFHRPFWLTRSKERLKRILLFTFRINTFPKPFIGIHSYQAPLLKLGIQATSGSVSWSFPESSKVRVTPFLKEHKSIVLVPSAAWEMKRWPLSSWKKLIEIMPQHYFIVLGGNGDLFCEELKNVSPERVNNLAGQLSLIESCALIKQSALVISADTGLLHVADVLGVKALSLMGPTAFGFTAGHQVKTLEVELPCRPCTKDGRGTCSQVIYQRCMVEITPARVAMEAQVLYVNNFSHFPQ